MVVVDVVVKRCVVVAVLSGLIAVVEGCGNSGNIKSTSKVKVESGDVVPALDEVDADAEAPVETPPPLPQPVVVQDESEPPQQDKVEDAKTEEVAETIALPVPSEKNEEPREESDPDAESPTDAEPEPESNESESDAEPVVEAPPRLTDHDFLKGFPQGADQMAVICARNKNDRLRQQLCGENPPQINSLVDLQRVLGLEFTNLNNPGRGNNGNGGNPSFVLTGHSSSLVARFTNAINPRAIIFSPANQRQADNDFVAMGFLRGEQFAEIIARDPNTGILSFFLVAFEQACNEKEGGCSMGDLLTPDIESNWTKVNIYEDEDLKNTIVDCLQCHQPEGPGTAKILRMQELRDPWTHFFRDNREGGQALIADYQLAHGPNETYAGIPGSHITGSDPQDLENLVRGNGFNNQNIDFDTPSIEDEVNASSPDQPDDNTVPGVSNTWQQLYDLSVQGEIIQIPYHDAKVTDPAKVQPMADAYRAVMNGQLAKNEMPDIRDIFKDDRNMGFQVAAGLDGRQILVQACRQCHNSKLDQNISRAKFNIDALDLMSREEKDIAIQRLQLPPEDLRAMPPRRFRDLNAAERDLAIKELQK